MQLEGEKELYVGGVHVRIFLKDPHFPLRNPKVCTHWYAAVFSIEACARLR